MEPVLITEKQLDKLVEGLYSTQPGEKRVSIIEDDQSSSNEYEAQEYSFRNSASMTKMDQLKEIEKKRSRKVAI